MLNDRLQIMMYEIPTNTTRQITTSRQNSSNPSIAGDLVVWQEWIDTNWEIMMTDVNNNGQAFEIERLTDNAVHDMFPAAYEGLITWHVITSYSIHYTKLYEYVMQKRYLIVRS